MLVDDFSDLVFLKDKHFMEDDYSVMILLNDTTLVKKNVKLVSFIRILSFKNSRRENMI